jgi:hypothetical protein
MLSRGKVPGQGIMGAKAPEAETFSHLEDNLNKENCTLLALFIQPILSQFVQKHCYLTNLMTMMSLSFVNNYANTYAVKIFL